MSKEEDCSHPSLFRPIALTNCDGKIFFSVVSERLQLYFVNNSYIDRSIQKGFLFGLPGCLEHSFSLNETVSEAYKHYRQVIISWIDLENAFGSIPHNLIQFALEWYHVPVVIRRLIFMYYERLSAIIKTKNWKSEIFN